MASGEGDGRQQGVLADWNDDRGFGFITPSGGGPRVFAHVSAFPRSPRPTTGSKVTYAESRDERNRARAAQVHYVGSRSRRRSASTETRRALAIGLVFFALLVGLTLMEKLPVTLLAAYCLLSVIALVMYADDKSAAVKGRWRTPETTLHTVALVGGWPGALLARPLFRHKTTKQPFKTIFWLTVIANCAALAWFLYATPVALP